MSQSAYPETIKALARQLREAAVDHEAFEMPLPLCQLSECRATCCHDGVMLSKEEADFISEGTIRLSEVGVKVKDAEEGLNLEFLKKFVGYEIVVTGLALEEYGGHRFVISITKKDQISK